MALNEIHVNSIPTYQALSTDIVNNKIAGLELVGAKVYITDTGITYTILPDYTLSVYKNLISTVIGNSGSVISNTNQLPTLVPCYMSSATIVRSSVTTSYVAGQLILPNGATTLPFIDFSTTIGSSVANRKILITSIFLSSSNGANTPFVGYIDLMNVSNPTTTTTIADYAIWNPLAATIASNFANTIEDISNNRRYGTTSWMSYQLDLTRKITVDANSKIYFAPVCTSAYTPISGESITLTLKYYLLN